MVKNSIIGPMVRPFPTHSLRNRFCFSAKVSKSFRTGRLERELRMVQLSATRCSYIAILWVSLMSFATITLRVASQRVFIVISLSTQSGNFRIHPRKLVNWPCGMGSKWTGPLVSKKVMSSVFICDFDMRAFLGLGDVGCFHWKLRHLLSGSYRKNCTTATCIIS
jgi:hypothetical protein